MPKPRNLAEERRAQGQAAYNRRLLDLTRRGYSEADAKKVVDSLGTLKMTQTLLKLTSDLGMPKSTEQSQLEKETIKDIIEMLEVVNRYEPEKVRLLMPIVQRYKQQHPS